MKQHSDHSIPLLSPQFGFTNVSWNPIASKLLLQMKPRILTAVAKPGPLYLTPLIVYNMYPAHPKYKN